jgi:hypothetical protein
MSQALVLQILKGLGGKATSSEIIKVARKKYPNSAIPQLVGDRLSKLMKNRLVQRQDVTVTGDNGKVKIQSLWIALEDEEITTKAKKDKFQEDNTDYGLIYACSICRKQFNSLRYFRQHTNKKH